MGSCDSAFSKGAIGTCVLHVSAMSAPHHNRNFRSIAPFEKALLNEAGGDGGGPSECDGRYHSNNERIVALSTGWYDGGSRCGRMIRITAQNGRSTTAKVVDECDSRNGCDQEHDYQPPCGNNIVDGSNAVWNDLGLNTDIGVVDVTWSMA
ncbi:hypothetical protein Scep_015507 [Stephania cephalantha]|uniref:Uncharacterized protein n=1 Tax=Stephania cephalantha TaxID=152367 RepID=A0AAP0J5S2_9MAGN